MCAKASLTIQDALEKEKSQYPHAPLRSISKLMLFSSSLHALFLLLISPLFYFFPSQLQYKKREPANLSLPLARSLSRSLSLNPSRWEEDEEEEVWAFSCCWLSPGTTGDGIWSTTVRLTPPFFFFFLGLTAPCRASVQPSPRTGVLLCVEHEGARLGALRTRWAVLLLSQRLKSTGRTAYAHTEIHG